MLRCNGRWSLSVIRGRNFGVGNAQSPTPCSLAADRQVQSGRGVCVRVRQIVQVQRTERSARRTRAPPSTSSCVRAACTGLRFASESATGLGRPPSCRGGCRQSALDRPPPGAERAGPPPRGPHARLCRRRRPVRQAALALQGKPTLRRVQRQSKGSRPMIAAAWQQETKSR